MIDRRALRALAAAEVQHFAARAVHCSECIWSRAECGVYEEALVQPSMLSATSFELRDKAENRLKLCRRQAGECLLRNVNRSLTTVTRVNCTSSSHTSFPARQHRCTYAYPSQRRRLAHQRTGPCVPLDDGRRRRPYCKRWYAVLSIVHAVAHLRGSTQRPPRRIVYSPPGFSKARCSSSLRAAICSNSF